MLVKCHEISRSSRLSLSIRLCHLSRVDKIYTTFSSAEGSQNKITWKLASLTAECQHGLYQISTTSSFKVGSANVRLSNIIPAGRYSGQGPVVKFHLASVFGLVSERPVFKTWVIGLNLCPPRSRPLPRMPGSRRRTNLQQQVYAN